MQLANNTVLITGGASGIGLAMAGHFHRNGSTVIAVGRREAALAAAAVALPGLRTRVCDVARAEQRSALAEWVSREAGEVNVLVNNAGIQTRPVLTDSPDWAPLHEEIAINLEAPIHLSTLLIPHLAGRPRAAIVNVTSGLAFVPRAQVPVYCATKAALHSFTLSLRRQLRDRGIEVVEIIPPAVNTDLGGPGLHTFGAPLDDFADEVARRLDAGEVEIAYGFAQQSSQATVAEQKAMFERMNA